MPFNYSEINLPVTEIVPQMCQHLQDAHTLLLSAPPGAGKSTLIPLVLMDEPWLEQKKIILLEPRRLAARTVAQRLAQLLGEEVGETVGYRIRFENRVSARTRIEVVTEGILTRMLQQDNSLEGIGLVIFDEFHERSLHADLALALCRESQQVLREDLRLLIMSATLHLDLLSRLLQAPVLSSEGRQYPIDIRYGEGTDTLLLPELMARAIARAHREENGDILAFFPGEGEIHRCAELLGKSLGSTEIHPLYGMLPFSKQQAAILPGRSGRRKVVLATSIAETSLTIEGVRVVIDSGLSRQQRFDPSSGLSRLETVMVSKDSADQRAGRAGRLGPGICYRLWSPADQERLNKHRTPEILEADLSSLYLELSAWGVKNINSLTWLNAPPKGHLAQAKDTLEQLGALQNGRITPHGKRMQQLPCHPRIAHLLLKGKESDVTALACDLAALLEERDPLPKEAGIDITLRIEALRRYREHKSGGKRMASIEKAAASYGRLMSCEIVNGPVDPYEVGLLVAQAYPERIASARPGNNAQFQLANGRYAMAGHQDSLAHEAWLAVAHVDARDGLGKIFLAAPLNPKDLAPMVKEQEIITWDTRKGGLIASKDLRIGNIVLSSTPLKTPGEEHLTQAICNAIQKEGKNLLNWDERVQNWQNRVLSLRSWRPDEGWPDVSTETLLQIPEEWLAPYLKGVKKPEDLKKLHLAEILHYSLTWDQQQDLDRLAPQVLEVPSGSKVPLEYKTNGEAPVLAVRLQQMFGLAETPRVNDNQIPVLLHLLSPSNRPVQVTRDLKNFWNSTYFEVKKELKRRYPKHSWPEDPWTAEAIKGVRRKPDQGSSGG